MACPTCYETMQGLGHQIFWCPTCGTIKRIDGTCEDIDSPRLTDYAIAPELYTGNMFARKLAEIQGRRQTPPV